MKINEFTIRISTSHLEGGYKEFHVEVVCGARCHRVVQLIPPDDTRSSLDQLFAMAKEKLENQIAKENQA